MEIEKKTFTNVFQYLFYLVNISNYQKIFFIFSSYIRRPIRKCKKIVLFLENNFSIYYLVNISNHFVWILLFNRNFSWKQFVFWSSLIRPKHSKSAGTETCNDKRNNPPPWTLRRTWITDRILFYFRGKHVLRKSNFSFLLYPGYFITLILDLTFGTLQLSSWIATWCILPVVLLQLLHPFA